MLLVASFSGNPGHCWRIKDGFGGLAGSTFFIEPSDLPEEGGLVQ